MRQPIRKLRWGFYAAVPVYAVVAYRIISQQPDRPGWMNCVLIYLALELASLIYYATCAISCGDADEPLDPACVRRCLLRFLVIQLILLFFLLSCMLGSLL